MEITAGQKTGSNKIVTVFGGSGFVGRHVVGALARRGYQVRVAVRRPDLAFHLQPLGDVGQVQAVQANLRFKWSIERAIEGANAVVNLVGILSETDKQKFQNIQWRGAGSVAEACKKYKLPLIHMSAIGANIDSSSDYCNSKGQGDQLIHSILKSAIILRPSIIFGNGDGFFSRFAKMAATLPVLPLLGGGKKKFQPVYVGDVAKAVALGVDGNLSRGKTYELGGNDVLTFRQCMELILETTGRNNGFISIPWPFVKLIAKLTGWIPGAPITQDQVITMQSDNVVSSAAIRQKLTLEGMGIAPKSLASILPDYLVQFRQNGQYGSGPLSDPTDA